MFIILKVGNKKIEEIVMLLSSRSMLFEDMYTLKVT
jgi:hypothetical protein